MKMLASAIVLALAGGVLATPPASAGPSLLTNGSFASGSFSGWTLTGNTFFLYLEPSFDGSVPTDGGCVLEFGPEGSDGVLSQTFSDVAGGTLTVSGALAGNGSSPSDFSVSIDGNIGFGVNPIPEQGFTAFGFTAAATGQDTICLAYRDDPNFAAVDDLMVTETMPIPEPDGAAMLGAGLLTLGLSRRRRG